MLSSAVAAATAATATTADTNKLVSLSHFFRQQHLPPHRPTFHRHKETRHHEKPDVAKMKLVNHHGNTGNLLPPVTNVVSSDDHHGNPEHSSTDSDCLPEEKQLTEDDRECVNEIRKARWQPQRLSLTEQHSSDSRAESVLYEYHLAQPTKVSVDNTTLPTVHRTTSSRRKTTNPRMAVQQQYKLPSQTAIPMLCSNNQDILTTKQLFSKPTTTVSTNTNSIAQHKDRIAQAVELAVATNTSRSEDTTNSKVAEIRLVFDNSPPCQQQQQQHLMGIPMISGHKGEQWSRPIVAAANRPHTTDGGISVRPLLMRKPATRAGMRPLPESTGE